MKTKITISLLATASFLFNVNDSRAQWTVNAAGDVYNSNSSGLVGLGLTAPASLFHAAGQIRTGIPTGGLGGASATTGSFLLYNSTNSNTVNIQSGTTSTSYTMTLPTAQGANGSVLTNDGSGGLNWLIVEPWVTSGNTLSGTLPSSPVQWIGTINAADWIIKTNSTERMRVLSTGNVGIGTAAPGKKIDVNGDALIGASNRAAGHAFLFLDAGTGAGNEPHFRFSQNTILKAQIKWSSDASGGIDFYTLGAGSFVRFTNAGNVGIGTTSPDFNGSGSAFRTLSILGPNTSATSCGILEMATQSTDADANIAGVLNFAASSNASTKKSIAQIVSFTQGTTATNRGGFMIFNTKPDGSTSTLERMRIDNLGNVGIGTSPAYKLHVVTTLGGDKAVMGTSSASTTSGVNHGGYFEANGAGANANVGLYASASAGLLNYGAHIIVTANGNDRSLVSAGTAPSYFNGSVGIGFPNPAFKLDVNGTSNFSGNMTITGNLSVNGSSTRTISDNYTSDQQFKTNVDSIHSALNTIKQLKPRSFYFDTTNVYGLNFSDKKQFGFIAQDVETILPDLVTSITKHAALDTLGNIIHSAITYKALNYNAFIGILTKGIQELQQKNDSLKTKTNEQDSINTALQNEVNQLQTKNTSLQNQINNLITNDTLVQNQLNQLSSLINDCCNNGNGNGNGNGNHHSMQPGPNNNQDQSSTPLIDVELNNKNIVILNQNVPNPFAEQTTISYYLPDNITHAQIIFSDLSGKIIKTIDLTEKGKGVLNVFANDLSNGIYTYSLIIDGQIAEMKKMVKN
ncbi:MAG: tail fiber domain-containing protein [Bacteroidia bacterium]|nr:tail fiber domain-containing protein [Bacteroidia bacterium]